MPTAQDAWADLSGIRQDFRRGLVRVQPADTFFWTYASAVAGATAVTGVNLEIGGCKTNNKVIKIRRIGLTGTSTTAGTADLTIERRSSLSTGGVAVALPGVQYDTQDPVSTANVRQFTTAPTAGTLLGSIRSVRLPLPLIGSAVPLAPTASGLELTAVVGQPLTLRLPTEAVTMTLANLPAATTIDMFVEWTEELVPGDPYPRQ